MMKRWLFTACIFLCCAVTMGAAAEAEIKEFSQWPAQADPQAVGQRIAARFLEGEHMLWVERNSLHYAEVAAWYGALDFAALAGDAALTQRLVDRFQTLLSAHEAIVPPVNHVDSSVFGALPLELYRVTQQVRYRTLGLAFADGQWDNPRADGLSNQTRFWIDDMYMITLLQTQAFRVTGQRYYLDRTAASMVAYLDQLQKPNGLFFHAPDAPFFWGRGNGWMAAGMAELLRSLPVDHPHHARILAAFRQMMGSLLRYQSKGGLWRQLIDREALWTETSSSAMFTFAIVTGVKQGWLDERSYAPAARRAWLALVDSLDADAGLREVCIGTGTKNDLQHYIDRPRAVGDLHGQAPMLWTVSALLRPAAVGGADDAGTR
jgi:unsaturated rhamnogalacturonyl hydrolase